MFSLKPFRLPAALGELSRILPFGLKFISTFSSFKVVFQSKLKFLALKV